MQQKDNLNVIRSIACLLIVNHHLGVLEIPVLSLLARAGFITNTIFIIMSGYLLTLSLDNNKVTFKWLKKRVLRIYPALIISIFVIYGVSLAFKLSDKISIGEFLIYLTGFHYFWAGAKLSPQLWFVAVILLCYLLFKPAKYFIDTRPAFFFAFLIMIFCGFTFFSDTLAGFKFPLDDFKGNIYKRIISERHLRFLYNFVVFCLAIYYTQIRDKIKLTKIMKAASIFVLPPISIGLYVYTFAVMGSNIILNIVCLVTSLLCAISFCIVMSFITPFLKSYMCIFTFLASISYELYLIHYVVLQACKNYLPTYFCYVFVYGLSILLAFLIHRLANVIIHPASLLKSTWCRQRWQT